MRLQGIFAILRVLSICAPAILPACAADLTLQGHVVDETDAPVDAAQVTVRSVADPAVTLNSETNPTGNFTVSLPGPGDFVVGVRRQGYYELKNQPLHVDAEQEITLVINTVREVFQSENVNAETSPLEQAETQNQESLSGTEVNNIPFTNSHSLRDSLQLMPEVVEDQTGAIHVNGSSENQVLYTLNGFDLNNPITGQLQTVLAVEGIRSIDLSSGRFSPEFGKGTAGVMAISTENGTDKFHTTMTDFIPGLNIQQGLHLGNWYPRFGVSGPVVKGKAWFSDTFDMVYNETLITGLPRGQDTANSWIGSNLLHAQWNVAPSNILYADFLLNVNEVARSGLGPLSPISTTLNLHGREYMGSLKDQIYFTRGALIEFGYAHNNFANTQTPQGGGLYLITPTGTAGNSFQNSYQTSSRDQLLVHSYLPQFHFLGTHQFQVGADADLLGYGGDFHRSGYEVFGLTGQPIAETLYPNPAAFTVHDTEVDTWLLDTWHLTKGFQFLLGIRQDWDQRIDNVAVSPRLSFAWSPFRSDRTRISGGWSLTHDPVTLNMIGQPFDQVAMTTQFNADGSPAGPPTATIFTIGRSPLVLPRAANWNLDIDHQLTARTYLSAKLLRRRGSDEFSFLNTLDPYAPPSLLPVPTADVSGVYQLANLRRDDFDSLQLSVRRTFARQFEMMAAYTWSRALSNAVFDPNFPQPLQVLPGLVPMPWDAPNRFLTWAYLPLPWKNWAISVLVNMRTGFPFSVRDQTGTIVGAVDSYRYPLNFDLNIALERMVTLHGYRFALRGGIDNATDQANPGAVNNVIDAPHYLQFLGDEGRHFVVRVRFFGRAQSK